jgi:hypothetical protein
MKTLVESVFQVVQDHFDGGGMTLVRSVGEMSDLADSKGNVRTCVGA